jgi:hypothetical protein
MGTTLQLKPKTAPRLRLAPGEELFSEPIQGRITCRACDAVEDVPLGHPALLCSACLRDLSATAQRVADEYAEAMAAFFDAGREHDAMVRANVWYAKTEAARADMSVSPELFKRAWEAAHQSDDERAQMTTIRDWLDECAELMRRAELRYLAARPELAAARAAKGEPVEVI